MSNRANGYRDILAQIDLSTYRRLPWEKNVPFFLCSFVLPENEEPLPVDPRSVLRTVLGRAEEQGWTCMAGAEFEVSIGSTGETKVSDSQYFQFSETPRSLAEKRFTQLTPLTPGSTYFIL